jgi:hypothetical protein
MEPAITAPEIERILTAGPSLDGTRATVKRAHKQSTHVLHTYEMTFAPAESTNVVKTIIEKFTY